MLEREIKLVVTPAFRLPALGEHQDAVVAERWLRAWVRGSRSVAAAFTAGELAGLERAATADARARWPETWRAFSMRRGGWP